MKKQNNNNSLDVLKRRCLRCGHEWLKRKIEDPMECPKCHSPYWNKKRVKGVKKIDA